VSTPTSRLLARVAGNGQTPAITAKEREQAALDLKAGMVGLVVVPVGARNEDALHTTLDNLLQQQGALVQDVWVWTIRG
jgi:hypothetical protein